MNFDDRGTSRRDFLRAGAGVAGAFALTGRVGAEDKKDEKPDDKKEKYPSLPKRKLGMTGLEVTVLNQGTGGPANLMRLLDQDYKAGIRYIDTADCYDNGEAEKEVGKWLQKRGLRKNVFIVTKDHPTKGPQELTAMLDKRLEALQTDYVDLFFIHQIGPKEYGEGSLEWPKSKELKEVFEKIKKSGKAKLCGFSCHDDKRTEYLEAAAEGGFVDAIMVAYTPKFTDKDDRFNKALDKCHEKGIGLIAMKGNRYGGANFIERWNPLMKKGLNRFQAVVTAILNDERISSVCSSMMNTTQVKENAAACKDLIKLTRAEMKGIEEMLAHAKPMMCHHCDGSCKLAAGTNAPLNDVARYLAYYEQDGRRKEARKMYREIRHELADIANADLAAAQAACHAGLDFAGILAAAETKLA